MTKLCFKCRDEKPIDEFYFHSGMRDGRLNKCKVCTRRDVRSNRTLHIEYYRECDRDRSLLPERVAARTLYAHTPIGAELIRQGKRDWNARNPEKRAAQTAVANAVKDGQLIRQPCVMCGSVTSEAHHEDYSKPLDVIWLCDIHHKARHKDLRAQQREELKYAA